MKETKQMSFLAYLRAKKSILAIGAFLIIGIILMMVPNVGEPSKSTVNDDKRLTEYANSIEIKIADLCSKVRGISDVSVSVYFDHGFQTQYAFDEEGRTTSSGSNSEKKHVIIGSGNDERMVIVSERMPNICGIAIVCRGGGDSVLSAELINLISAAYGVPKHKIYVAEGKK